MTGFDIGLKALLVFAIGFTLGVVVAVVWFYARESVVRVLGIRISGEEERLLKACHGDRELAERLLAAEIDRSPTIARDLAARRARTAMKRDRR